MTNTNPSPAPKTQRPVRAAIARVLLVLLVCVGVCWAKLGSSPFAMSEGMRAFPAWEMMDRNEHLVPFLFEQSYARKPPGVQWLIAVSSDLLGRTEFAARAPSALALTLGSLVSMFFAARWFGPRWCVWAGLSHALTPFFWYPGRSAEIEAPHNLFVQLLVLAGIDLLMRESRSRAFVVILGAVGVAGAALTKGPAGAPCIAGVVIGCCIARRAVRTALNPAWMASILAGAACAGAVLWMFARRATELGAVTQSPAGFLWDASRLAEILLLPLIALGAGAPSTLAFAWLLREDPRDPRASSLARALFWNLFAALAIYTVVGIANVRYAMPALGAAPVAMAWCMRAAHTRLAAERRARFVWRSVPFMFAVLAGAALVNVWWSEGRRERISGKQAAEVIAASLKDGDEVWANQVVEYRPEVLWYAQQAAARDGRRVRVRWMPGAGAGTSDLPPSGALVLLLAPRDAGVSVGAFERAAESWELLARAEVHKKKVELRRAP